MTIYFAGGEDINYTQEGGTDYGFDTLGGSFRSDWSRGGVSIESLVGGTNFPAPNTPGVGQAIPVSPEFTNLSDFWFHTQVATLHNATSAGHNVLFFASPDGIWRLGLQGTGTGAEWRLVSRDSGGSQTVLASSGPGVFQSAFAFTLRLIQLDVHIVYGTSGSVDVFVDGGSVAVLSFSGDTTTGGATELNKFFLGTPANTVISIWSETIISDLNTRSMGVLTLNEITDGNTQDWVGSAGDINEADLDDDTFIYVHLPDKISEWTVTNTIPSGRWVINAVTQAVRGNTGGSSPTKFEFAVRPNGGSGDFFSSDVTLGASLANFSHIWEVNPDTSLSWMLTDLGAGFNLGIKSIA